VSATLTHLPQVVPDPAELRGEGSEDHPMRRVTRQVAFQPDGWTSDRAGKVAALFDSLAPEWHTRMQPGRLDSLLDALQRGGAGPGPAKDGLVVELGSGTGFATPLLVEHFVGGLVVAMDLSREMLVRAPDAAARVQADASELPLADGSVSALVLVNMLLFPVEVDRVLAADGSLVWVNSLAELTPIHLSAQDVGEALPGRWEGLASRAGGGTWCVLRRAAR
jgi:SAM-dependent methyltransferase